MTVLVRCFSYTPHASLSEVFLLPHASSSVSLRHLMLTVVRCVYYTPGGTSSEMFLLHTEC